MVRVQPLVKIMLVTALFSYKVSWHIDCKSVSSSDPCMCGIDPIVLLNMLLFTLLLIPASKQS